MITGTEDRQHVYVALTRGTDANLAYVFTASPKRADPVPGPRAAPELARYDTISAERAGDPAPATPPATAGTALGVLSAVLERDGQQRSATQARRQALADADHLALLHAIWTAETSPGPRAALPGPARGRPAARLPPKPPSWPRPTRPPAATAAAVRRYRDDVISCSPSCAAKSSKSLTLKVARANWCARQHAAIQLSLAGRGRPRRRAAAEILSQAREPRQDHDAAEPLLQLLTGTRSPAARGRPLPQLADLTTSRTTPSRSVSRPSGHRAGP